MICYDHNIICINLDKRKDRWENILIQKDFLGLEIERFSAIEKQDIRFDRPFAYGCRLSHFECLKIAHERNYDKIMIIEDDCVFHKQFKSLIVKYIEDLEQIDYKWDILHCGDNYNLDERITDCLYTPKFHLSNVCYVYNADNDREFKAGEIMNENMWERNVSTDILYSLLHKKKIINIVGPKEPLAIQFRGYSDLRKKYRPMENVHNTKDYLCKLIRENKK